MSDTCRYRRSKDDTSPKANIAKTVEDYINLVDDENELEQDGTEQEVEELLSAWGAEVDRVIDIRSPTPNPATGNLDRCDRVDDRSFDRLLSRSPRSTELYDCLVPGKSVELWDGDFVRIKSVVRNHRSREIALRGWRFRRAALAHGKLDRKLNELYWILRVDHDDPRPEHIQALENIQVGEIVRPRELRLTNHTFPACSFRTEPVLLASKSEACIREQGPLVCRVKYVSYSSGVPLKREKQPSEWALSRITEEEADERFRAEDQILRSNWRQSRTQSNVARHVPQQAKQTANVDLTREFPSSSISRSSLRSVQCTPSTMSREFARMDVGRAQHPATVRKRDVKDQPKTGTETRQVSKRACTSPLVDLTRPPVRCTFGDAFCGAGGASTGAEMAGFTIRTGIDFSREACETYRANFPRATTYCCDISDFFALQDEEDYVDLLHISPPCQPYSPAHTWDGKDDERNEASLTAVGLLLQKTRCRFVTMEETFGILQPRHAGFLHCLINQCTTASSGFSVRWGIFSLDSYGLCQPRKRLILYGAAPGERLPEFPKPTHSTRSAPCSGLRPATTVNDCIASLEREPLDLSHPLDHAARVKPTSGMYPAPYDGGEPLRCCVKTSGSESLHPSGRREFSARELAALQGFPRTFRWPTHGRTILKRQIGNAVPPVAIRTFFSQIRRHMDRCDAERDVKERGDV